MPLVLFENTFLVDATTYVGLDPAWIAASTAEKERALSSASFQLNDSAWMGSALDVDQSMAWPRTTFSFFDSTLNLWVECPEGTVPKRLERAVAYLALHFVRYPQVIAGYDANFDSITVGPISVSNSNADSDPGKVPTVPGSVAILIGPLLSRSALPGFAWWRAN